jgi:hypothetical protein
MLDLISLQPNLNIPLYLVAPKGRRKKVIDEVNRPTFQKLEPPLVDVCRYIPFETLQDRISNLESKMGLRYLKPEFLEELSEDCYPEEER